VAGSFQVHLESLRNFARLLDDQLEALQRPTRALAALRPDLPLGAFAEAYSLGDDHSDVASRMLEVLAKLGQSVEFGGSVTSLVASRYGSLSAAGARGIAGAGDEVAAPAPSGPATGGVAVSALGGAATGGVAVSAASGTATPPPGSLAPPEVIASIALPAPPPGGTVYYYDGNSAAPVSITIQAT